MRLSAKTLPRIQTIAKPAYDRAAVQPSIAHLGVGGFARSHLTVYCDDLLNQQNDGLWGLRGIGLQPGDEPMLQAMRDQDCLYTVLSKEDDSTTARVVGSMVEYVHAPSAGMESVLGHLTSDGTRMVSMTVTEKGYHLDGKTVDFEHPAVQHDIQNSKTPTTAAGVIVAALKRRRDEGIAPFSVLSCDNLEANGELARAVVVALAEAMEGQEFAAWVRSNVAFPSSMVDRITPATTDADTQFLAEHYDVEDAWPVVCEEFRQWVIEDTFCNGRPRWEDAGAMVVPDVYPYELMKLRLLNSSHSALAYFAYLSGERQVHEAMAAPHIHSFVESYMDEVMPSCLAVPGVCMDEYKRTLLQRFANTGVADQVQRLAEDGSTKVGSQMLSIITENLAAGRSVRHLGTAIAAYLRYMSGTDLAGQPIAIKDPKLDVLQPRANEALLSGDPTAFVGELFGEALASESGGAPFVEEVRRGLAEVEKLAQ